MKEFGNIAKDLSRNPLGLIALFLVLIYGLATLILTVADLEPSERNPLIWFLVIFPVLVLGMFGWLVSMHHTKLYAPSDYRADETFLRAGKIQAYVSAGVASAKLKDIGFSEDEIEESAKASVEILSSVETEPSKFRNLLERNPSILWVDDHPGNNIHERQVMEALGLQFVTAVSTEEALKKVKTKSFGAIISDMGRPPDARAGYTLLKLLRDEGNKTPYIIYAGSRAPEHLKEAIEKGAVGTTNRPDELFKMVLSSVASQASPISRN